MKNRDIAIIGAGIAGVSAAIYARRAGLDCFLFERSAVGGQLAYVGSVDNYPGICEADGPEIARSLSAGLEKFRINIINKQVDEVTLKDNRAILRLGADNLSASALIVAAGARFKTIGVEGEHEFSGRGVSYCAVCDGFFFRGKDVAVIGGGNTALEDALYLSAIARKVYLVHRRDKLRAVDCLQKELFAKNNVEVVYNSVLHKISGSSAVESAELKKTDTGDLFSLNVSGVFVAVGVVPNTSLFRDKIKSDDAGFIITDEDMRTSVDYVWACGDCRRRPLRQLITAASEGATAAMSAYKYLKGYYISA